MIKVSESTIDHDGYARWPDTYQGSEEYYSIDCTDYLTKENDTLTSVAWTVPAGLTELDSQVNGNIASIKLRADTAGDYFIEFELNSSESVNTQKTKEEMRLVVY